MTISKLYVVVVAKPFSSFWRLTSRPVQGDEDLAHAAVLKSAHITDIYLRRACMYYIYANIHIFQDFYFPLRPLRLAFVRY